MCAIPTNTSVIRLCSHDMAAVWELSLGCNSQSGLARELAVIYTQRLSKFVLFRLLLRNTQQERCQSYDNCYIVCAGSVIFLWKITLCDCASWRMHYTLLEVVSEELWFAFLVEIYIHICILCRGHDTCAYFQGSGFFDLLQPQWDY